MNKFFYGIFLAAFSSALWGLGGNFTQYIFAHSDFNYISLVFARMFVTSLLFLLFGIYKHGSEVGIEMIKSKKRVFQLLIYSFFGMLGVQLPFYATIQYSSAPFATLMQFGAPVLVIAYFCIKFKKLPKIYEVVCTILILIGVFFVVTNGNYHTLSIDLHAIIWGVITSFGYAFYIVDAKKFFDFPTPFLMGYSMLIGSLIILPLLSIPDILHYFKDTTILIYFFIVVIVGTFLPFYFLIESSRHISPTLTCLLAVVEPIVSLIVAINFMGEVFGMYQLIGIVVIIISITAISFFSKSN